MIRLLPVALVVAAAAAWAQPSPVINQGPLPDGRVGSPYSQTLSAHGGTLPYNWQVTDGALPPGLTLGSANGTISGTPTRAGNYQFTAQVTDADRQRRDKSFRLTIADAPPLADPPVIQTGSLPDATAGASYSQTLTVQGGAPPYTWSLIAGNLPGGIALNSGTGTLSGTPAAAGTFTFTIRVNDSGNGVANRAFSLVVKAPPVTVTTASLAAGQVGQPYSASLGAAGGTPPYTWSVASGSLPAGLTLASAGTISGTPSAAGTSDFTVRVSDAAGGSATQALRVVISAPRLDISTAGLPAATVGQPYSQALSASGGTAPYTWSVSGGTLPAGLSLNGSGTLTGTPTAAGDFNFTARVSDSAGGSATKPLRVSVNAPALGITSGGLPTGTVGQVYNQTLTAGGGTAPYTWSIAGGTLPPGVSLGGSGGLSGTPTTAGDFDFTARVADAAGASATKALRVSVNAPALVISSGGLPTGTVGQAYNQTLTASGGTAPYTWSVAGGTLPPGVSLNSSGSFSGTPTTAGDFDFTARVADSAGTSATKALRVSVNAPALVITSGGLPAGTVGQAYNQTLTASGGTAPYTWSIAGGTLPPGVSLNGSGSLSGTPTTAGDFDFTARVADAAGTSAIKVLRISVNAPALVITSGGLPAGTVGQAYSQTLTASGGTAPYTWSLVGGTLPSGVSLNGSGTVTGTPATAGDFDFTARVADSAGTSAIKVLRISVNAPALTITSGALPTGTVSQAYNQTLTASGGTAPYTWSLVGGTLPSGVSLNGSGTVTGTPATAGDFDFTARVADSAGASATRILRITINAAPVAAPSITTSSLPAGTVGQPYAQSLTGAGGAQPYNWTVGAGTLPPGIALNTSGALSGTPTTAGDFDFTAQLADAAGRLATRALRISIGAPAPPALTVTTAALPSGNSGQPYSFALTGSGGAPPYTWIQEGGVLPAGVTLNSSGLLSGTPTVAGNFDLSVRLTDSANATTTRALRLTVVQTGNPLSVTTDTLARATAGQAFTASLTAAGGTSPYTWALASGTLPPGITLAPTGALAGTPTTAGDYDFAVRVADAAGVSAGKALRLSVSPAAATLNITTTSLPAATAGAAYAQALVVTGGRAPYTWTLSQGSLPAGITLDPASGRVAGAPLTPGSYSATFRATDADNRTGDRVLTLVVGGALSITCPAQTAARDVSYTSAFAASGGTAPYFWSIASGQLPPGVTLNAAGGTLTGTPSSSGSFAFAVTASDASGGTATRSCTITVQAPLEILTDSLPDATTRATYSQRLRSQGGTAPFTWSVSSGALPPGLTLDPAAGSVSGQPSQPGRFNFALQVADAAGARVQRQLSISVVTGLTIPACPTATTAAGQMFSSALVAVGGVTPYAWSVPTGTLPQGLALASDTGLISGRATQAGATSFTLSVSDAAGASATRNCSITVAPEFRMLTGAVAGARLRSPYSQKFEAEGGTSPYVWYLSSGALPPGLTLDGARGEITGTPAVAGTFRFTVRVADATGLEVERPFEIVVAAGLVISACPTPTAVAGDPYSAGLTVGEARPPVVWSLSSGALPDGLQLVAETGVIVGVPTLPGSYEFAIRASDASSDSAGRTCSIAVAPAALRVASAATLADALLGTSYTAAVQAAGGQGLYVWTVIDGSLPPGLALDPAGTLQGTPSEAGTWRFTLQVQDQTRALASRAFELRVLPAALPAVRFADMPEIVPPAQQPRVRLTLDSGYPADLRGTLTLRFQPDPGLVDDPSIRFVTGARTANFTVPANATDVVFDVPELALQTGSVSGTIELAAVLFAGDADVTPNPAPVRTLRVDRTAPVISSVRINPTAGGFEVVIVGISPTRDVTAATFQFTPAPGSQLQATQVVVPTDDVARRWFQDSRSAQYGGQFSFVQPFSVQGASLSEVSVTLTNGQGTSQPVRARF